jgi:hypothetical protein
MGKSGSLYPQLRHVSACRLYPQLRHVSACRLLRMCPADQQGTGLIRVKKNCGCFFFCEGPRRKCYGHTAALRLIVQPCDEYDQSFFRFSVWNEIDRGKPKYSGKNLSHCHFVHHKFHLDWPGIFFILSPLFPFDPFCTFKSFRPSSCHLRSILVLVQQTQHRHPCPRRDSNPQSQ